jgi:DNA-binding transcriptional regulator YiaG
MNIDSNSNHFELYLQKRQILPSHLHLYIFEVWEDKKLGKPPSNQTVFNWIGGKVEWRLTLDQWQSLGEILGLSVCDLKILLSGRSGCKKYGIKEIEKVMAKKPISDPDYDLRYLIKKAGLTQVGFGHLLGVSYRTVQDWCAGLSEPHLTAETNYRARKLLNLLNEDGTGGDMEWIAAIQNSQRVNKRQKPCGEKDLSQRIKKIKIVA